MLAFLTSCWPYLGAWLAYCIGYHYGHSTGITKAGPAAVAAAEAILKRAKNLTVSARYANNLL